MGTLSRTITLTLLVLFTIACQPQVELVTVTREVEVTREIVVDQPAEIIREIEVTREVPVTPVTVEVTRVVEVETSAAGLPGTPDRPFQILFLPGDAAQLVNVRGGLLLDYLVEQTGYSFEIVIPADRDEALNFVCNRSQETIAILLPEDYVTAVDRCNAQLSQTALRFDVPYRLGMIVALRDRVINVIEDLSFKTVGVPDQEDLATYGLFAQQVAELELAAVEFIEYGTSSAALIALLNGEIDVATADYNPPILPREERVWEYGQDSPEIWREIGIEPERDPIGYVDVAGGPEFGGYRLRDARAAIFDDYPEIFNTTRIVSISEPIPNEAIIFSRDFPLAAARLIGPAIETFANSDSCAQSVCASDFYGWSGVQTTADDLYDILREIGTGVSEE